MNSKKKPLFKSVPTYRDYKDYHDAEQYTRGWNDAMRFIFGIKENNEYRFDKETKLRSKDDEGGRE